LAELLETKTTLKTLDLSGNQIVDEGATVLAQALKSNDTLTNLNLDENQITNVGATALAEELLKTNSRRWRLFI
jgi:Leucine-rich repeat (LRR) protein